MARHALKPPVRSLAGSRRTTFAKIDPPREIDPPGQAPVFHAAAACIARADDEVGVTGFDGRDEPGQDRRVVRPVGIHLEDDAGAARERDAEPVEVRAAEARLPRPVPDADARLSRREAVGKLAGPVRRRVVHDEQRAAGQRLEDRGGDAGQVLRLVVGRHHDPRARTDRNGSRARASVVGHGGRV